MLLRAFVVVSLAVRDHKIHKYLHLTSKCQAAIIFRPLLIIQFLVGRSRFKCKLCISSMITPGITNAQRQPANSLVFFVNDCGIMFMFAPSKCTITVILIAIRLFITNTFFEQKKIAKTRITARFSRCGDCMFCEMNIINGSAL